MNPLTRPGMATCLTLGAGLLSAVLLVLPEKPVVSADDRQAPATVRVTHGPILGRPGATSVGVWARTSRPATLRVHYGTAADRLTQKSPPFKTRLEKDNTGWVLVERLKPGTRYYYRVAVEDTTGKKEPDGFFLTLPSADSVRNERHNPRGLFNFKFELGSCANQGEHSNGPSLPAYRNMFAQLAGKAHFAVMNGDFIYEEKRDFSPKQWLEQVGARPEDLPEIVRLAPTITGVWENYKLYLERGKNLARWHRHVPSTFTFDDHEILNDVYGCGEAGVRDRRAVFRDIAVRAWYDYLGWSNPVSFTQGILFGKARLTAKSDVLTDPKADFTRLDRKQAANLHIHWGTPDAGVNEDRLDAGKGDPNAGVYEIVEVLDKHRLRIRPAARADGEATYSIGRRSYYQWRVSNCAFYALDTRTHRQKHDAKNPARPGPSLLGKEQEEWLKTAMAKSDADFLFVISSVPFTVPHTGAGGMAKAPEGKDDSWTAFLHERGDLIKFWDGLGKPVFVMTGDLHNSFAVKITGRVWEFCCGPHNSTNHNVGSEENRPANGPFNSRGQKCDIQWSTFFLDDVPRDLRRRPMYCVVQVNNVFDNPLKPGEHRWVAYPRPQVVFQYHDGKTGELLFAQPVLGGKLKGS
jgi:alkaline phosphatase D